MTVLTTRLAEWCGPHQGLARRRPPLWMGVMGVVDRKRVLQARWKILGRMEIAALEKPPGEDAKPPCHLVEPGAVFGGKVEDLLMGRITQERTPLYTSAQGLGHARHTAPLGAQAADGEAPVGVEGIHHPVLALPRGQLVDHRGQRGGKIGAGARLAQMPHDLPCGNTTRGEQGPHPMPDRLVLALLRLPWGHGLRRGLPLQHLPPSLFIGADDDTTVLEEAQGLER
jgi:hypothetical protein